jgi:hypothetical protein
MANHSVDYTFIMTENLETFLQTKFGINISQQFNFPTHLKHTAALCVLSSRIHLESTLKRFTVYKE